ncbi:hypothetical protein HU200_003897 [Digitaria exilis]|uniref:NAC domain-containing protein n=1 Tax=Digitaria exilis TaxID=1010633 RepID=A0A835FX60_9POAL|nr:hypothetical protein HU200_031470 [Digitaria exilis]KAF8776085.1 hypothetical protein HU200_003897 [Digitaria exilis]
MDAFTHVPPGFRFHPTDEELVDYYLRKKVALKKIDLDVIKDVDLYKIEPWDLQEKCKIGNEEQNEWYFFSHKDKKYPTGTRTNRATTAGFWKATGRDKPIYVKNCLVGMRKTLVFYKGRAPNGQKSDWIMHEYRLETNETGIPHEEGWVVCRVFRKRLATVQRMAGDSPYWFNDHTGFMAPNIGSPRQHFLQQLPQLESPNPKLPDLIGQVATTLEPCNLTQEHGAPSYMVHELQAESVYLPAGAGDGSGTDWSALDKFVASQFSHGDTNTKESSYSNPVQVFQQAEEKEEEALDFVSTSASCGRDNDLWK